MFNKIQAIKVVREKTAMGLKDAKDLVELLGDAEQEVTTIYSGGIVKFLETVDAHKLIGVIPEKINGGELLDMITACITDDNAGQVERLKSDLERAVERAQYAEAQERKLLKERDDLAHELDKEKRISRGAMQVLADDLKEYGDTVQAQVRSMLLEIDDLRIKLDLANAQINGYELLMAKMRDRPLTIHRAQNNVTDVDTFLKNKMEEMDRDLLDRRDAEDYQAAMEREERYPF